MQIPVYDLAGQVVEQLEVSEHVFGVPFNEAVVHQAVTAQRANARQGNASTKTRGEVDGSSRKLFAQKHTGNARAGSLRSPLRRKGGIVFGPRPHSFHQAINKKMRRLALRCVLSEKARGKDLLILRELDFSEPKTKEMVKVLAALDASGSTALIALPDMNENVIKSARNIPGIRTMRANLLNVVDVLSYGKLVMPVSAVREAEQLWGDKTSEAGK
jgi:large subunit ribosomal protein L4